MSELNEKVEEPQEQAPDRAPMPDEELQKILEAHRMWVESEGKEGERADLLGANLQKATLTGANLRGANLADADGLTAPQVKPAKNWELAFYSDDFLRKLGLPSDHNGEVEKKLAELKKKKKATGAQ